MLFPLPAAAGRGQGEGSIALERRRRDGSGRCCDLADFVASNSGSSIGSGLSSSTSTRPVSLLAMELDGKQHFSELGKMSDEARTRMLNAHEIRVLRLENIAVLVNPGIVVRGDFRSLFFGDGPLTLTLSPRGGERKRVRRGFEFPSLRRGARAVQGSG